MSLRHLCLILLLALPGASRADGSGASADSVASGDGGRLLLPVLAYSPETSLMAGGMCLYRFPAREIDGIRRQSSITGVGIYTLKNQSIFVVSPRFYGSSHILGGGGKYLKFPQTFYGVGRDTREEDGDDYTPETVSFELRYKRRLGRGHYLGLGALLGRSVILESEADGLLARRSWHGAGRTTKSELHFTALRDLRDSEWFPTRGTYLLLKAIIGERALGGDLTYRSWQADARWFRSPARNQVLAVQAQAVFSTGETPFADLPTFGGQSWIRGFLDGRYRDRDMAGLQAEYRFRQVVGNWGCVLFAGLADVAPEPKRLAGARAKRAAGLGLRYLVDPEEGVSLRCDFAWNGDELSFYVDFSEAF